MKDEGRRTKDEGRNQAGTFVGRSLVLSAKVKKQRRNKKIRIEKKAQGFTRKQRSSHVINVISPTLLQLPVHRIEDHNESNPAMTNGGNMVKIPPETKTERQWRDRKMVKEAMEVVE
ncbi:uncharacterized protein LOC105197815 isoform X2 [Solenopsis invicta]|uniref:uncharacterized protein LOC105197815 isoform X2 n=1 Tax=Solenopsis invicta TaxID=13686 RepID=UPI000595D220|nr:uncharacterized protein LOC105197815 isoform X2 [Solenopsis invicta]